MRKQVTELHFKNVRSNKVNLLNNMCYARCQRTHHLRGKFLTLCEVQSQSVEIHALGNGKPKSWLTYLYENSWLTYYLYMSRPFF